MWTTEHRYIGYPCWSGLWTTEHRYTVYQFNQHFRSPRSLKWPFDMGGGLRLVVHRPLCVNVVSSRTTGPILTKELDQEIMENDIAWDFNDLDWINFLKYVLYGNVFSFFFNIFITFFIHFLENGVAKSVKIPISGASLTTLRKGKGGLFCKKYQTVFD